MEYERYQDGQGVVQLRNCQGGLGIKICGGKLKNGKYTGIYVKRIMIGGVAAEDGNLREGDQLLQVNGQHLERSTNDEAVGILRRESQKGNVSLVILRNAESRSKFEDLFGQEVGISSPSLSLSQLQGLHGNSTLSRTSSVSSTGSIGSPISGRKRSWVYTNGRMSPSPSHYGSLPNLQIGHTSRDNGQETTSDDMLASRRGVGPQSAISRKIKAGLFAETRSPSLSTVDSGLPSNSPYPSPGNSENDVFNGNQVQTISIPASRGLGISIYGGSNESSGPFVYIDEIIAGCDADVDNRLQSGDLLVSINGESFTGVSYEQARAILMRLKLKKVVPAYKVSFIHNPKEPLTIQDDLQSTATGRPNNSRRGNSYHRENLELEMGKERESLSHSSEEALLHDLTDMMSKLHSEEELSPSTTLKNRSQTFPRPLPTRMDVTQVSDGRGFEISRPFAAQHEPTRFTPGYFSTPHVNSMSPMTNKSIPHYLSQDLVGQQSDKDKTLSTLVQRDREKRRRDRQRRLSLDANTRIRMEKLEEALEYLGYSLDSDQRSRLRRQLHPDANRSIAYGEFVDAARNVLGISLSGISKSLNEYSLHFAVRDIEELERNNNSLREHNRAEELQMVHSMSSHRGRDDVARVTRERDEALREVKYLREKLKEKDRSCTQLEDDLNHTRQEIASSQKETAELRNRVQLANEAQRAARLTEQDNDQLIRKLEKEISSIKTARGPSQEEFNELQKRLVVLGCQLRKAEVSKRTYEVAVEKLTKFAETVHDSLVDDSRGSISSRRSSKSDKRSKKIGVDLAVEARETVKAVKLLLEEEPLPFGWEEVYSPDGTRYYINHVTQTTSWIHPVSGVQYLPTIKEDEAPSDKKL